MSSAFTNQNRKEIALSGSDWSPHQMRNSDYDNDTVSRPTSGYDSDMWTYGKNFVWLNRRIISNIMEIHQFCFARIFLNCRNYNRFRPKVDSLESNWTFFCIKVDSPGNQKWTFGWSILMHDQRLTSVQLLNSISRPLSPMSVHFGLDPENKFFDQSEDILESLPVAWSTQKFRARMKLPNPTQKKTCEIFVLWIVNAWFD